MSRRDTLEDLLGRFVEHHVLHGTRLSVEDLCAEHPDLADPLRECIDQYERLGRTLSTPEPGDASADTHAPDPLPTFEGFRTIERLGGGGGGEVYRLEDLELGRHVAAKIIRSDSTLGNDLDAFLQEARSMALFADPRFVRLLELRKESDPPVLLMEYVEGFELGRVGRSLEYGQRARIMAEIAEAVHHAHGLGLQHRDLKPANVLLDPELRPKILDFGLSRGDPGEGHGKGTPSYMAPELLDVGRPIDARTDVYALGVMLYELLCGARPYTGRDTTELLDAIRSGSPRLPVEVEPTVPEPLQAIALKAMERDPDQRYATASELAQELRRWIEGKPVLARPSLYHSALERRVRPHLEQIREWLRIKLIYRHEAERLRAAYRGLEAREDDWIVESRVLSASQIALYLGAFLLFCGSVVFFASYQLEGLTGLLLPALVLGGPFVGLNLAGRELYRRERRAVAVAYYLAALVLLPLCLLVFMKEVGVWPPDPENTREFLEGEWISNRQLQVASLFACVWAGWLAWRTRTVGLASGFTFLLLAFAVALLTDFGLRQWLEDARWDSLALHLVPLLTVVVIAGFLFERDDRSWFARPLYYAGLALYVIVLELLAQDGKAFEYLGVTLSHMQDPDVSNPLLLDTLTAMTLNGVLIYLAATLLERRGTTLMRGTVWLAYVISPFAILQPVGWLVATGEYSLRFDWFYLLLALAITFVSRYRQRRAFYWAGLLNTGSALWFITSHNEWFDHPWWGASVVLVALLVLGLGLSLESGERRRRTADS